MIAFNINPCRIGRLRENVVFLNLSTRSVPEMPRIVASFRNLPWLRATISSEGSF